MSFGLPGKICDRICLCCLLLFLRRIRGSAGFLLLKSLFVDDLLAKFDNGDTYLMGNLVLRFAAIGDI